MAAGDSKNDEWKPEAPVSRSDVARFIVICIGAIRTHTPGRLVTVGVSTKYAVCSPASPSTTQDCTTTPGWASSKTS